MTEFPFGYERIAQTTWAYLSALLMLGLFFKFSRFWSVRNLDLVFLILLSPGLILVTQSSARLDQLQRSAGIAAATRAGAVEPAGEVVRRDPNQSAAAPGDPLASETEHAEPVRSPDEMTWIRLQRWGFIWLFGVGALYLLRLLFDPRLVRKPLLEPNLSPGGLTFLACCLFVFLFADILQSQPLDDELNGPRDAMRILERESDGDAEHFRRYGPGLGFLHVLPVIPTFIAREASHGQIRTADVAIEYIVVSKIMAALLQAAIVAGLIVMGQRHFRNPQTGLAMAVIYLMLPATVQYAGNSWHMLPAALTLWAVVAYRQPLVSGILIGLAVGVSYYPLFLLPLWFSFYWERGRTRFAAGVIGSLVIVIVSLVFTVETVGEFFQQLQSMFGVLLPRLQGLERSIWNLGWDPWFRLPILVGFIALSISFVFWPIRKNLGTLVAYSAALMVAVQFWLGYEGGLFIAWYMPLALLSFFRPNLDQVTARS
jgi:hypothetical protein